MTTVLLVGCGQLGTAIAGALHQQGLQVIGVRKSDKPLPNDMQTIQADVLNPESLTSLKAIHADYVIYCVAANARTDEAYAQYYVQGLQHVIDTQTSNTNLKRLFFISSTRVYGQTGDALLNENTLPVPNDFGGQRLLEAERLLLQCHYKTTVLRLSGIYSPERLYLVNMAKQLAKWPASNGWSNRIHQADAVGFIAHLFGLLEAKEEIAHLYLVTDSQPARQYEVLLWLAQALNVDVSNVVVPNKTAGKRLDNQKVLGSNYVFQYPNYQTGYTQVLKTIN